MQVQVVLNQPKKQIDKKTSKPDKQNDEKNEETAWTLLTSDNDKQAHKTRKRRHRRKNDKIESNNITNDKDNNATNISNESNISIQPETTTQPIQETNEINSTIPIYCKWYQDNACMYGNNCHFRHEFDPKGNKSYEEFVAIHNQGQISLPQYYPQSQFSQYHQPYQEYQFQHQNPDENPYNNPYGNPYGNPYQNELENTFYDNDENNGMWDQPSFDDDNMPSMINDMQHVSVNLPLNYNNNVNNIDNPNNDKNANSYSNSNTTYNSHIDSHRNICNTTVQNNVNCQANNYNNNDGDNDNLNNDDENFDNIVINDQLLENVEDFNEENFEVWEDDNGEVIIVPKDQLYADDPDYHNLKMLKEYRNAQSQIGENGQKNKILRHSGGAVYGVDENDLEENDVEYDDDNKNEITQKTQTKKLKYSQIVSKYQNNKNQVSGYVESFDIHSCHDDPNAKICTFWLSGNCRFDKNCRSAHRFPSTWCPNCLLEIGKNIALQQNHMLTCPEKNAIQQDLKESENANCGICMENVMKKNERFGILTECNHTFCLTCIRQWRGVLLQSKDAIRGCPICRVPSYFIVPSSYIIHNEKRKQKMIESYKKSLSEIPCKHFKETETCPFGSSCFYKHIKKDGTIEKISLRHAINSDGKVEIMKSINLSEFFFS